MEHFDIIVVGSGSGMLIVSEAVEQGLKVALVEKSTMGGTCINRGCVPSKMLIYPSDVIAALKAAQKIGINASVNSIDFGNIMTRMHTLVNTDTGMQARAVEATPNLKWFKETGEFISDYTMQVGTEKISGDKIFIVSGARVAIPPIKGLENVGYLTSDTVLDLQKQPESIIIIGGGYVGMEYAHFFAELGTKVTVLQRADKLLQNEEPEISDLLKAEVSRKMDIYTGYDVLEAKEVGSSKIVVAKNLADGSQKEFLAQIIMVAAGRVPNTDILKPETTGLQLDERGFIKVDEYLETGKKNIWALGDAIGKAMFKHAANYEAGLAWHNANHDHKAKMDYFAVPHAVFTHPQIASVGLKEQQAKDQKYSILVGVAQYKDTAMGAAMGEPEGFVKVIVERETGKILGAHIIGPEASMLIQEIINAMVTGSGDFGPIARAMHIHPALPEVIQNAFGALKPV
ncbi:MAG: dihydrolipoyl dehydrogenase [Candidatus Bathyarchaeota archaeon]|nr:dihydrolipoyl dehydrogenase [Candidatus Bathyarchaeota archaeon]